MLSPVRGGNRTHMQTDYLSCQLSVVMRAENCFSALNLFYRESFMLSASLVQIRNEVMVKEIMASAQIYKNEVAGKKFLVIFEGKYFEVSFKAKNFLHLCGVDTGLRSAIEFYRRAISGKLKATDISFSKDHPYELAVKKVDSLKDAIKILWKDVFVVSDIVTKTHFFKFGASNLNVTLCINEDSDKNGNIMEGDYVPCSLRVENISGDKFFDMFSVDYVFIKDTQDKQYSEMIYGDKEQIKEYIKNNAMTDVSELIGPFWD